MYSYKKVINPNNIIIAVYKIIDGSFIPLDPNNFAYQEVQRYLAFEQISIDDLSSYQTNSPYNVVYVSPMGDDIKGIGTISNPVQTFSNALELITTASNQTPYTILGYPNITNESNFLLKPNVSISCFNEVTITANNPISLHASWANTIGAFCYYDNLNISGEIILDFTGLQTSEITLIFSKLTITQPITIIGDGNQTIIFQSCICENDITLENIKFYSFNSYYTGNSTTLNNITFYSFDSFFSGDVTVNSINSIDSIAKFHVSEIDGTITVNGSNAIAYVDTPSYSNYITSSGGQLILTSLADSMLANFTPVNYTPVTPTVKGHLQGIDNALDNVSNSYFVVYVSKHGSDTTGNGSFGKPYATISHAMTTITTATSSNPIAIMVFPGIYSETSLALKPFVFIYCLPYVNVTYSGSVTLHSSWNSTTNAIAEYQNLNVTGTINIDFTGITATTPTLTFKNNYFYNTMTLTGDGSQTFYFNQCTFGDVFLGKSIKVESTTNRYNHDLTLETDTGGGLTNHIAHNDTYYANISVSASPSNTSNAEFYNSAVIIGNYTVTGSGAEIVVDATSYNTYTALSGGVFVLRTVSESILGNFSPVNFTPVDSTVKGFLQGIDQVLPYSILSWVTVSTTTQQMAPNVGYIADNASQVVFTLPTTFNPGNINIIIGKGAGGWKVAQNNNQIIHVGSTATTTGTSGYIQGLTNRDCIEMRASVANLEMNIIAAPNLTVI